MSNSKKRETTTLFYYPGRHLTLITPCYVLACDVFLYWFCCLNEPTIQCVFLKLSLFFHHCSSSHFEKTSKQHRSPTGWWALLKHIRVRGNNRTMVLQDHKHIEAPILHAGVLHVSLFPFTKNASHFLCFCGISLHVKIPILWKEIQLDWEEFHWIEWNSTGLGGDPLYRIQFDWIEWSSII